MIEKTFAFGYPFFLRVIFPGFWASIVLYALLWPWIGQMVNIGQAANMALFFSGMTIALGLITTFADLPIYSLYEGRACWPGWLRRRLTRRLQSKIDKLVDRATKTTDETDEHERAEIWAWLRRFPRTEEGRPQGVSPTLIGNILSAYEGYPLQRYGMDSVFYWHRIWLTLDDKTRREIDSLWAPADAVTYLSFLSFSGFVVSIPLLIVSLVHGSWSAFFAVDLRLLWGATTPSLLLVGWMFYMLSLPLHVANGEIFKSVFDVYRKQVEHIVIDAERAIEEKKRWHASWDYLQYYPGPRHPSEPKGPEPQR